MKKLLYFLLLLSAQQVTAQKVIEAEYFIDVDPGYGKAVSIKVTPGVNVDTTFNADLSSISTGIHQLQLRARDDSGHWSITYSKPFFKGSIGLSHLPNITQAEYFIDTDPGYGKGTPISIPADSLIDNNFVADLSALSPGFHILSVRARDENGSWGLVTTRAFLKGEDNTVNANTVVALEYYLDNDPGYGLASPANITTASSVDTTFNAALAALNSGVHIMGVRAKDNHGAWSITYTKPIIKGQDNVIDANIVSIEYYIDTDPGYGMANPVNVISASSVDTSFSALLSGLDNGFHMLGIRAKDDRGAWGITQTKPFLKSESIVGLNNVIALEYFIDNDPGYGLGKSISITSNNSIDTSYIADLTGIDNGFHTMGIRAKDENNVWSLTNTRPFLKGNAGMPPALTKLEYFVDTDPGFRNGVGVALNQKPDADTTIVADLNGVPLGKHLLYIRASDELRNWSHTYTDSVDVVNCVNPVIKFTTALDSFCVHTPVLFTDSTTRTGPGSKYYWDFDNDGMIDDTTRGNTLHTYDSVGVFTIKLRIKNAGGACSDSIFKTIVLNPVPQGSITALSTATFCQGDSVTLQASSAAKYQWSTGATTQNIVVDTSGIYMLTVTNVHGCPATAVPVNVTVLPLPAQPVITKSGDTLSSTSAKTYQWFMNDTAIAGAIAQKFVVHTSGHYRVFITDSAGCSNLSDSVFMDLTGIGKIAGGVDHIYVYPNPYSEEALIQYTLQAQNNVSLELYDLLGTRIKVMVQNEKQDSGNHTYVIDKNVADGVYLLKLSIAGHVTTSRIIKAK